MKCKIFSETKPEDLEKAINKWMVGDKADSKIDIRETISLCGKDRFSILLYFDEELLVDRANRLIKEHDEMTEAFKKTSRESLSYGWGRV